MWKSKQRTVLSSWPRLTNVSAMKAADRKLGTHPKGVNRRLGIFLEWWQKGWLKGQESCPVSSEEVQERLKSLLSSAKFPLHFCAQLLHFPGQLIIMDMDSSMPWPCQIPGGKWRGWLGWQAKGEQTGGETPHNLENNSIRLKMFLCSYNGVGIYLIDLKYQRQMSWPAFQWLPTSFPNISQHLPSGLAGQTYSHSLSTLIITCIFPPIPVPSLLTSGVETMPLFLRPSTWFSFSMKLPCNFFNDTALPSFSGILIHL